MKAMVIESELRYLQARNEVAHADDSKIKAIFGEDGKTSLSEGLKLIAYWVNPTGIMASSKFENIEITEKLTHVWLED